MKISIICVYNNNEVLDSQLLSSLKKQNIDYEFIGIDNAKNKFNSAAAALNYGASQSSGDVLVFSHQDIILKEECSLYEFANAINQKEVGVIVGTQGVREKDKTYYSNLTAGAIYDPKLLTDFPKECIKVDCVDEGFFGMKKETWKQYMFDEVSCDNWHLYAVDQCLNARKNGYGVFVYPIQMHHFSFGRITISYFNNLRTLCNKYRKSNRLIWTTCYKVYTNPLYINFLILVWSMNRILRRKGLN